MRALSYRIVRGVQTEPINLWSDRSYFTNTNYYNADAKFTNIGCITAAISGNEPPHSCMVSKYHNVTRRQVSEVRASCLTSGAIIIIIVWSALPMIKKESIAVNGTPSHSYGVSLAVWDHTVLPATRHKRTHPAFTPAGQAGTRFTDHLRVEGWVSPGPGCKEQLAHWYYATARS